MRLEVVDRIKGVIHDLWPSAEVNTTPKPLHSLLLGGFTDLIFQISLLCATRDYIILAGTNGFVNQ